MHRCVAPAAVLLCLGLSTTACSDESELFTVSPSPTEIAVDPLDFLGPLHCSNNAGAIKSYIVTLAAYDDVDDVTAFTLPSSQPTACSYITAFRDLVIVGKRYTAEIDGYDVPAQQLSPFGGSSGGSRHMLDAKTKLPLTPRWTTRCGKAAASATVAVSNGTRFVADCEPLSNDGASVSSLRIDPTTVLGEPPCEVASAFDIVDVAGLLPPLVKISCNSPPIELETEPNKGYALYASAIDLDDAAVGTMCFAQAIAGETVTLSCNPVTPLGAVRLDLSKLVDKQSAAICPAGAFFDVVLDEATLNATPLACSGATQVGPLTPGLHLFVIPVYDSAGEPVGVGTTCAASAQAGKTVDAICE